MHKDFVLFNLTQAHEALAELIADMKSDPDYDYGAYIVDIAHVYHHLTWHGMRVMRRKQLQMSAPKKISIGGGSFRQRTFILGRDHAIRATMRKLLIVLNSSLKCDQTYA
jgi:hypothetical protein